MSAFDDYDIYNQISRNDMTECSFDGCLKYHMKRSNSFNVDSTGIENGYIDEKYYSDANVNVVVSQDIDSWFMGCIHEFIKDNTYSSILSSNILFLEYHDYNKDNFFRCYPSLSFYHKHFQDDSDIRAGIFFIDTLALVLASNATKDSPSISFLESVASYFLYKPKYIQYNEKQYEKIEFWSNLKVSEEEWITAWKSYISKGNKTALCMSLHAIEYINNDVAESKICTKGDSNEVSVKRRFIKYQVIDESDNSIHKIYCYVHYGNLKNYDYSDRFILSFIAD